MRRPVFAADPAVVLQFVEQPEQPRVVDLALVRLVAVGHAGNLEMPDMRQPAPDLVGQVAFDDLRVIQVHLHAQVGHAHLLADRMRLALRRQQVVRHVARIDGLDQQRHVLRRRFFARILQVAHVDAQPARAFVGIRALRQHAGHHVQPTALQRPRVTQRRFDTLAAKSCSRPGSEARPRSPASQSPGGMLNSTTSSFCTWIRDASSLAWYAVRKRELDRAKSGVRGFREPFEERHFVEQEREIGGKAEHRRSRHRATLRGDAKGRSDGRTGR